MDVLLLLVSVEAAAEAGDEPEDDVAPVDDVVEDCKKGKVGDDGSDATDRRAAFPIAMETFSAIKILCMMAALLRCHFTHYGYNSNEEDVVAAAVYPLTSFSHRATKTHHRDVADIAADGDNLRERLYLAKTFFCNFL